MKDCKAPSLLVDVCRIRGTDQVNGTMTGRLMIGGKVRYTWIRAVLVERIKLIGKT